MKKCNIFLLTLSLIFIGIISLQAQDDKIETKTLIIDEVNTTDGSANLIAKAYASYTDIAGSGMHNNSNNIISMTKITTGTDRVRVKFNGTYANSLAIVATPIQQDISSGYFCTVAYVDSDEVDIFVHLLNAAPSGDQSFSFIAFATN